MSSGEALGEKRGATSDDLQEDGGPSDADLGEFEKLKQWIIQDQNASSKWRTEARIDSGFARSQEQWTPEDRVIMEANNKPCVTFDYIGPTVNSVAGMEVSNRQEVTYLPRTTQRADDMPAPQAMGMPGMQPEQIPGADDTGPSEIYTAA